MENPHALASCRRWFACGFFRLFLNIDQEVMLTQINFNFGVLAASIIGPLRERVTDKDNR